MDKANDNTKLGLWSIILILGFVYLFEKYGLFNVRILLFMGFFFVVGWLVLWGRLKSILVRYSWGKRIVSFVNWVISLLEPFTNLFSLEEPRHVDGDPKKMSLVEKWIWRILLAPITGILGIGLIYLGRETMAANYYISGGICFVFGIVFLFLTWKILRGKIKTTIVRNPKHW